MKEVAAYGNICHLVADLSYYITNQKIYFYGNNNLQTFVRWEGKNFVIVFNLLFYVANKVGNI